MTVANVITLDRPGELLESLVFTAAVVVCYRRLTSMVEQWRAEYASRAVAGRHRAAPPPFSATTLS